MKWTLLVQYCTFFLSFSEIAIAEIYTEWLCFARVAMLIYFVLINTPYRRSKLKGSPGTHPEPA